MRRYQGMSGGVATPFTLPIGTIMKPFTIKAKTKAFAKVTQAKAWADSVSERKRATDERLRKEAEHKARVTELKPEIVGLTDAIRKLATEFSTQYPGARGAAEAAGVDTREIAGMADNVAGVMAALTELPIGSREVGVLEEVVGKLKTLLWVASQATQSLAQLSRNVGSVADQAELRREAAAARARQDAVAAERRQQDRADEDHRRRLEALNSTGESFVARSRFAFEETRRLRRVIANERAALALDLAQLRSLEQRRTA